MPAYRATAEFILFFCAFMMGRPTWISLFHGGIVVLVGLLLLLWCSGHSRPGLAEQGEISGPWRFVRHPIVVSRFLVIFGFILIAKAPLVFAFAIVILGMQYRRIIAKGDQELSVWLGPSFAGYRLFVPSLLPQFLPVKLPQLPTRIAVVAQPWSLRTAKRRQSTVVVITLSLLILALLAFLQYFDIDVWWSRAGFFVLLLVMLRNEIIAFITSLTKMRWRDILHLQSLLSFRR